MRLLAERAGVLAEPSGPAAIAALLEHRTRAVVSVITGSNFDRKLLPRLPDDPVAPAPVAGAPAPAPFT